MKAVICAIAKYEYDYIKEWVEYHLNIGFDKIIIYDNNDLDGEKYDELLSEFIEKEQVELRDVRGQRAMQRVVYNEFYHNDDFDWVAIIDIDEFITINKTKYKSIKEFIEKNSTADAIFLYWQTYGDSGKTYPEKSNKQVSILKQYNKPSNKYALIDNALKSQNSWGKSIIKKGLQINYLHEHFVTDPVTLNYVDCFGKEVSPYLFYPDESYVESTYKECYIKHLYTKSLQEYIDCKVKRPAANSLGEMHFPSKYFKVNDINEDKRKYLESIGYKMEFVFKPDAYVIIEVKNLDEYNALKPYILNIISLCSCRFNLCVTEDISAVETIRNDISGYFNECAIYYNNKNNTLSEILTIYDDDRANVVKHTNCIVHINIPYNVELYEYIQEFIHPIFNSERIKQNFNRVFNIDNSMYVSEKSIRKLNEQDSDNVTKLSNILNSFDKKINTAYIAETGNFIVRTCDFLKWKEIYDKTSNQFDSCDLLMLFISNMFSSFLFTKT